MAEQTTPPMGPATAPVTLKTYVNRGRDKTPWLAIPIPQEHTDILSALMAKGWREFNGRATKIIRSLEDINRAEAELQQTLEEYQQQTGTAIGIDLQGIEGIRQEIQAGGDISSVPEGSQASQELMDWVQKIRNELAAAPIGDRAAMIASHIENAIESLASSMDEASKNKMILDFKAFQKKMSALQYNYSPLNTLLIFWQTGGRITIVKGEKQWIDFGRTLRDGEKGVVISAPVMKKSNLTPRSVPYILQYVQDYNSRFPQETDLQSKQIYQKFTDYIKDAVGKFKNNFWYILKVIKRERFATTHDLERYLSSIQQSGQGDSIDALSGYKDVLVYDIEQTDKMTDEEWDAVKNKKSSEPLDIMHLPKEIWQSKYNTPEEHVDLITQAAVNFATELGINIDFEADLGNIGGVSSMGDIAINLESKGQRQLGTTIHELAHEILHGLLERTDLTRKEMEIDAESVLYVVMKYFGFDPYFAPNYLAIKGASPEEIIARKESISKASENIISGIIKYIEADSSQTTASVNWYTRSKITSFVKRAMFNIPGLIIRK